MVQFIPLEVDSTLLIKVYDKIIITKRSETVYESLFYCLIKGFYCTHLSFTSSATLTLLDTPLLVN